MWEVNINVNPENVYTKGHLSAAVERDRNDKFVHIGGFTYSKYFLISNGICDVTIAGDRFMQSIRAFPVYKGFPYLEMFNKRRV